MIVYSGAGTDAPGCRGYPPAMIAPRSGGTPTVASIGFVVVSSVCCVAACVLRVRFSWMLDVSVIPVTGHHQLRLLFTVVCHCPYPVGEV